MEDLKCPKCEGVRLKKYGRSANGVQKYRCLGCRRQFMAVDSRRIDPQTTSVVTGLLEQKIRPSMIKKAISGISIRSIYKMRQRSK